MLIDGGAGLARNLLKTGLSAFDISVQSRPEQASPFDGAATASPRAYA